MAWKRQRDNGSWEFQVKKKGLLPKPISLTFQDEAEGDLYVAHLEKLLDAGIVPDEFKSRAAAISTIGQAISAYLDAVHTTADDVGLLNGMHAVLQSRELSKVNHAWAEEWVSELRASKLAPSTIRKKVGALARCFDWTMRRENTMLAINPLRSLPKRYSTTATGKQDEERDRRLLEGEEARINAILNREKPEGRERPLALPEAAALKLLFTAALESAMRMREIYTLTVDQVSFKENTIFLDKTKNGDKRQVPMSSVLRAAMKQFLDENASVIRDRGGRIFPFWDGDQSPEELRATSGRLSQQWKRIFSAAKCDGLHFHDIRHEATSRLYERTRLTDVQISRITGHKSLQMLRRYSNLRGCDLAAEMW